MVRGYGIYRKEVRGYRIEDIVYIWDAGYMIEVRRQQIEDRAYLGDVG